MNNDLYTQKIKRRPIIDPLLLVLRSRRVLIAVTALGVGLVVSLVPQLEAVHTELLVLVLTLALTLIGGYSVEDAAAVSRQQPPTSPDDVQALVKAALIAIVDEATMHDQQDESSP